MCLCAQRLVSTVDLLLGRHSATRVDRRLMRYELAEACRNRVFQNF